jgi:beta-phosphoglucomutase
MIRALQAVILDFDGVIANSEPLHLKAFQDALAEQGLQLTADEYYTRYLGYDDVGLLRALSSDRRLDWGEREVAAVVALKGHKLEQVLTGGGVLFPGAADFIAAVAARVPLAIASGAMRHEILEILRAARLERHFTAIVAAGDTPQSKPSAEPYLLAFERLAAQTTLDLDRRRCVAVEDSRWGLESARAAGLRCVGVTTSYPADQLPGAELVVSGLSALTLDALDRLCDAQGSR